MRFTVEVVRTVFELYLDCLSPLSLYLYLYLTLLLSLVLELATVGDLHGGLGLSGGGAVLLQHPYSCPAAIYDSAKNHMLAI